MSEAPGKGSTLRTILWALLLLAVAIGAVTLRVVIAGELEIAASTQALLAGDPREATTRARTAALWYAPGAPHVRVAYERLMALGDGAEKRQNREIALLAFRGVRTASESTRWLYTPHAGDARRANEAIARLESTAPRPPDQSLEPAQAIERSELSLLARETGPRPGWVVALALAFVAWAAGVGWVLFRAIDESGKVAWARARWGLGLGVSGMALWCAALYLA